MIYSGPQSIGRREVIQINKLSFLWPVPLEMRIAKRGSLKSPVIAGIVVVAAMMVPAVMVSAVMHVLVPSVVPAVMIVVRLLLLMVSVCVMVAMLHVVTVSS